MAATEAPSETIAFVGNLPFSTTEETLHELFSESGDVSTAKIVKQGSRSRGYGFVEFANADALNAAVAKFNEHVLEDRSISVQPAKSRPQLEGDGVAAPRRKRTRNRKSAGAAAAAAAEGGEAGPSEGAAPRASRSRRRKPTKDASGEPRPPRVVVAPEDRVDSKTQVFVANLPFSVTDEGLKTEVFAGFSIKAAKVVVKRTGRSKGFGFVDFNSEEEQKRAIESCNGKVVDEREIRVTVAQEHQAITPAE